MRAKAAGEGRMAWADVAKAGCILLVVLFHAYDGEYRWLAWRSAVPAHTYWGLFNDALKSVRMPLFFLVSGLLAAASIARPWHRVAHKRVYNLAFLYLLWAVILSVFFSAFRLLTGVADEPFAEKLLFLLLGVSWAWYLGALPAFFLFARLTRSLPIWVPLAFAYTLAVAAEALIDVLPWSSTSMMRSLLFFVVGARLPQLLSPMAAGARVPKLLVALAAVGAAAVSGRQQIGLAPMIGLLAAASGVLLAAMAARLPGIAQGGSWLAARTLPIYLLHFPVLAVLGHLFRSAIAGMLDSSLISALFPLVLTAAAVPISLALHRVILMAGGGWLFALPDLRLRWFRSAQALA